MNSRSAILSTLYADYTSPSLLSNAPTPPRKVSTRNAPEPAHRYLPTYNAHSSGRRYSALDQINAGNVNPLTLAWIYRTPTHVLNSTPARRQRHHVFHFARPCLGHRREIRRQIWHTSANPKATTSAIVGVPCTKIALRRIARRTFNFGLNAKDGHRPLGHRPPPTKSSATSPPWRRSS